MEKPPFSKSPQEISTDEAALFAVEIGDSPSLDLHGLDAYEAERATDLFLNTEFMNRSEGVRIIHGRGQGILRNAIHKMLKTHPLVSAFRDAQHPGQLGGVTVVALKKR